MTAKNYFLPLLIAAVVFVPFAANAQITIGSGDAPQSFSVLELISNNEGGLRLPQIESTQVRNEMFTNNPDFYNNELAWGLKIFNMQTQCVEYWSGSERGWISLCDGRTTIDIDPDSPWLNRPPFTGGGFVGRTYFDIAFSNLSGRCGDLGTGSRQAPYTHGFRPCFTEVYSFVGNGDILNLTFGFENLIGSVPVILNIAQTGNSVTVFFNPALADAVQHRHRSTAYQAVLFAAFDVPGQGQQQYTFHIRVADCAPCGAYVGADEWREFMCHNLGADTNLHPFTPHRDLHGHMFRWGLAEPAMMAAENILFDHSPPNWASAAAAPMGAADWDMENANPCPEGFRVPKASEWQGVIVHNPAPVRMGSLVGGTANFTSGIRVGDALFLPAAGNRISSHGGTTNRGSHVGLWSSTSTIGHTNVAHTLTFSTTGSAFLLESNTHRNTGMPIRCIAE